MNLIELSEQLKDVPDQLLMKEVQAPSGAYPSYLVVTEMSRRKRMRDQAQKEAPTTTVAQDLAQPSREQMMAAMAATQQRMGQQPPPSSQLVSGQGPQGPQAQMMSQPAPRLNAGIMAAPQAANALSAQDVMAAEEPRRMAGGGMVAFAKGGDIHYDDRGAVRFQNQGAVPRYGMRFEELPEYRTPPASSMGELFGNMFTRPGQRIDPVTGDPIYIAEFLRRQEAERTAAAAPVAQAIFENAARANPAIAVEMARTNPVGAAELAQRDATIAANLRNAGVNTGQQSPPAPAPARPPAAPGGGSNTGFRLPAVNLGPMPTLSLTPITDPYEAEAKNLSARFAATREPTAEEAAASRQRGAERYAQEMPFRYGFLEKDIAKREKDIEGRRASNINEALIQTGLGIMGSKSPRFLQAAGEAGTAGLNAYRQGLKDIREGEKDILQSKTAFANAQTLYDQGKFAAGDKEEDKANARYERGLTRMNTESAILARNQNAYLQQAQLRQQGELGQYTAGLNALKTQMEMQKLPYEMNVLREQAGYYSRSPSSLGGAAGQNRLTDADQKAAEEAARMRALMSGNKFGTPEYQNAFNNYYSEELQRRAAGINYNPQAAPQGGPRVPAAAPGALPPGWSVQVQPPR
jgi:hypothetical protein